MNDEDLKFAQKVGTRFAEIAREEQRDKAVKLAARSIMKGKVDDESKANYPTNDLKMG